MPEYRRSLIEGGTFFFTVVTYNRLPILISPEARRLLCAAWENVRQRFPFAIDAVCLLLEHIHCIWTLPEGGWAVGNEDGVVCDYDYRPDRCRIITISSGPKTPVRSY